MTRSPRRSRLHFEWRYLSGSTPWDTGVTPPEVIAFLDRTPPGRAVDFGCGTGTNAVTMATRGWEVTGVDFSWRAIAAARRKARRAGVAVAFLRRDVTRLDDLRGPFDFGLDIGCFHSLEVAARPRYATHVGRLLRPGAPFMLDAFLDPDDGWPSETDVRRAFEPHFALERIERGEFEGRPSGWFTWTRRP